MYSNHNENLFGCKSTNNQKPMYFCLALGNEYQNSETVADQAIIHLGFTRLFFFLLILLRK